MRSWQKQAHHFFISIRFAFHPWRTDESFVEATYSIHHPLDSHH
ncbi:hypothetical protein OH687_30805 [Burkholderia anthina]|nr:hypothetical protein OH687_30805 [Burkholderia anthina]